MAKRNAGIGNAKRDEMHKAYVKLTQEFLKPWIAQGATWTDCQQCIEFGDDERDEDVVNPLFPDMDEDSHVADQVNINDAAEDARLLGKGIRNLSADMMRDNPPPSPRGTVMDPDMREDHHVAPEPVEEPPYCDMCGGRHEQGHCHDLQ